MTDEFKKWEERYQRKHKIICPYCEEEYEDDEYQCISYYGTEDELWEIECPNLDCEKIFYVKEIVDRTYKAVKCQNCEDEGLVWKTVKNDSGKFETTKVPCKCTKIAEQVKK